MFKLSPLTYTNLPNLMYHPAQVSSDLKLKALWYNQALDNQIQLNSDAKSLAAFMFSTPYAIAMAYGGHQFGHYSNLGDGRALLLYEHVDAHQKRYDLHLKGSGATVYARGGDGRAPLAAALKEVLISEALHALDIPTARSLALYDTSEMIERYDLEPGGLICRVASSHIRVGTFQYAYVHNQVKALLDYTLERHFPHLLTASNPAEAMLKQVITLQAELIAKWQAVGFIHGVMNSDNLLISGESIDFGPCAFMETYRPNACYSSIDLQGRYAYQNQAKAALDNLGYLAQTLLSEISSDQTEAMHRASTLLDGFMPHFEAAYQRELLKKIGIDQADETAFALIQHFLMILQVNQFDYTQAFIDLTYPAYTCSFSHHDAYRSAKERILSHIEAHHDSEKAQALRLSVNPIVVARPQKLDQIIQAYLQDFSHPDYFAFLRALQDPFNPRYLTHEFSSAERYNPSFKTTCGT